MARNHIKRRRGTVVETVYKKKKTSRGDVKVIPNDRSLCSSPSKKQVKPTTWQEETVLDASSPPPIPQKQQSGKVCPLNIYRL